MAEATLYFSVPTSLMFIGLLYTCDYHLNSNSDLAKLSYSSFAGCEQNLENALLCDWWEICKKAKQRVNHTGGYLGFVPVEKDNLITVVCSNPPLEGLSRHGEGERSM